MNRAIVLAGALLVAALAVGVAAAAASHRSVCSPVHVPVALSPGAERDSVVAGTLCRPRGAQTLQVLLSGATYGRAYWDFPYRPKRYSYVRRMTRAGYATLAVDRIGIGESDRPPAAEVTVGSNAYVLHQLVQAARADELDGTRFARVVTVGHSLGAAIALVEAARYDDVDALVLASFLAHANPVGAPELVASLQPAQLEPRFAALPPGYLTSRPGTRGDVSYFAPGADERVVEVDEQTKETVTAFELATLSQASRPEVAERIDVPVFSAVGEFDNVFCSSSCAASDSPAYAEAQHYPNVPSFETFVQPHAGHAGNLHLTAPSLFAAVRDWLRAVGA